MSIKIINPGVLSTIQDKGRFALLDKGFSPSGAADLDALMTANVLVGNDPYEACIEMTLMGATVRFERDCVIAVSGGRIDARLDGEPIKTETAMVVCKNSYLNLTFPIKGSPRAYLAVGGGFDLPLVFGSRSTSLKFGLGGYEGRALRSGDVIGLRDPECSIKRLAWRKFSYEHEISVRKWYAEYYKMPSVTEANEILLVRGPQDDKFTDAGLATLFSQEYTVSPDSDRMGIRLQGKEIEAKDGYDIISDGIVHGSVQVSKNGLPIMLGVDRQTTGGYAKIATVASVSLPLLGRLAPGMRVKFTEVSAKAAEKLYRKKMNTFAGFA